MKGLFLFAIAALTVGFSHSAKATQPAPLPNTEAGLYDPNCDSEYASREDGCLPKGVHVIPANGGTQWAPTPRVDGEGRPITGRDPIPANGATGYTSPCAANEVETAAYDRNFKFIGYICVKSNSDRGGN